MSSTVTYEIFSNNGEAFGDRAYSSNREGGMGRANTPSLNRAYSSSPIYSGQYTIDTARRLFAAYSGENVQYGMQMYRRNFIPSGDSRPEYQDPRNKLATPTGAGGLPATPYSPNVVSPGEGNGNEASLIATVDTGTRPAGARTHEQLNPALPLYENHGSDGIGSQGTGAVTGTVRTFRLGVGSAYPRDNSNP